jgi:hypothetical protein
VDVVGAEDVADAGAAVVVGALPLRPALRRPAGAGGRAQADRPHLIEAHHGTVVRRLLAQSEDPRCLHFTVGVGAGLPGAGALERQAGLGEQRAEMTRRDLDPLGREVMSEPWQRPARQRDPLSVGTGTGHADDPLPLISRDPAGTPAPIARAQAVHPALVELMNHLPHPRRVGAPHLRDLRHRHPHVRGQQHRRPLTGALVLGAPRQTLQPHGLLVQQRPNEHRRGTHHHLHGRDASQFDGRPPGPCPFQAQRFFKGH